jgi:hypothetical protein
MTAEKKHPLALRGRGVPDKAPGDWHTTSLVVHRTQGGHALVSLLITGGRGRSLKDSRLGECWIPMRDNVGREYSPLWLLSLALQKLHTQSGARLLPEATDTRAKPPEPPGGLQGR